MNIKKRLFMFVNGKSLDDVCNKKFLFKIGFFRNISSEYETPFI